MTWQTLWFSFSPLLILLSLLISLFFFPLSFFHLGSSTFFLSPLFSFLLLSSSVLLILSCLSCPLGLFHLILSLHLLLSVLFTSRQVERRGEDSSCASSPWLFSSLLTSFSAHCLFLILSCPLFSSPPIFSPASLICPSHLIFLSPTIFSTSHLMLSLHLILSHLFLSFLLVSSWLFSCHLFFSLLIVSRFLLPCLLVLYFSRVILSLLSCSISSLLDSFSPLVSSLVKVCVLVRLLVVVCAVYGFRRDIHQQDFNLRPLIHPLALLLVLCLSPVADDFEINLLIIISDGKSCVLMEWLMRRDTNDQTASVQSRDRTCSGFGPAHGSDSSLKLWTEDVFIPSQASWWFV